ncbi:FHA domain-containing protein, partial [Fibrobacterota bacterium]
MSTQLSITVVSGAQSGKEIPVSQPVSVGRNSSNSLCFQGAEASTVSGFHAEISLQQGRLLLTDKNSTNGTFVNGRRVASCEIVAGDV